MLNDDEFERRRSALEQAVAAIQRRLANVPGADDWLNRVIGPMSDVEGFDEALK